MPYRNTLFVMLLFIFAATGCRKQAETSSDCEALKQGMTNGDKEQVRVAITAAINNLPVKIYTK